MDDWLFRGGEWHRQRWTGEFFTLWKADCEKNICFMKNYWKEIITFITSL